MIVHNIMQPDADAGSTTG